MLDKKRHLVILSPVYPGIYSGHAIAIKTSIDVLYDVYDHISFIVALGDTVVPQLDMRRYSKITFHPLGITRKSPASRMLRALLSKEPAIVHQYCARHAQAKLDRLLKKLDAEYSGITHLLVEHLPVFSLISDVSRLELSGKMVIRSHDVLVDAFSVFANDGPTWRRLAWKMELKKIRTMERTALEAATAFGAITSSDAVRYNAIYNTSVTGVLGVRIDVPHFENVTAGDINTVVHIGGVDLRKMHGISKFLEYGWPKVRRANPDAKIIFGGFGSEILERPSLGIRALGGIEDEREVMGKGLIFINPQEAGSGVKIKSLHAMAANKALVSTENGIGGIAITRGHHCVVTMSPGEMGTEIVRLMSERGFCEQMGKLAKQFVSVEYSYERAAEQYRKHFAKCI